MTYLLDDKIKLDTKSTHQLNAFGRLRTADSRLLGEYRYMYGSGTTVEVNDLLAGAGVLVKDQARNCYLAQVGTGVTDRVVRQTKQYHPYITGTTNVGVITFVMGEPKQHLTQAVGLFDDLNGFIFRVRDGVAEFVIRKNGIDAEVVPQSQWNGDRLDGTKSKLNQSGVLANFTKAQILHIDYQWLGIGKVRMSFVYDDNIVVAHTFYHANSITEVYTNQPSLPCRWEIKNTGATVSASELMVICAAVYCEGADVETGFTRTISTEQTVVPVTAANSTNGKGILAVRLKNTLEGKPNHALARLKNYSVVTNADISYRVVILPGASAIANNPTWQSVPGYGWCEYIKDFTMSPTWATDNNFQMIVDDFAIAAQGNKTGNTSSGEVDNRSCSIFQNYDANDSMIFAIVATRLVQDANVRAALRWIEIK